MGYVQILYFGGNETQTLPFHQKKTVISAAIDILFDGAQKQTRALSTINYLIDMTHLLSTIFPFSKRK